MAYVDREQCYSEIKAYLEGTPTGHALLINTESTLVHRDIAARLESNPDIKVCRVSAACKGDGLPDMTKLMDDLSQPGNRALIGFSQFYMLQSAEALETQVHVAVEKSIQGRLVLLLTHCDQILRKAEAKDERISHRVVHVTGERSALPQISVVKNDQSNLYTGACKGMHALIEQLENLSITSAAEVAQLTVQTAFPASIFSRSMYTVVDGTDLFAALRKAAPELVGCDRTYGTDEQWTYLSRCLSKEHTLSDILQNHFGGAANLPSAIGDTFDSGDDELKWLLWLLLKLYGAAGNPYLTLVLGYSKSVDDFEEKLTMSLLEVSKDSDSFKALYNARKRILESMPENLPLLSLYCQRIGRHEKNAVWYLTDATDEERLAFLQCLEAYEYDESEILAVTAFAFPELNRYLGAFRFSAANTVVPESNAELRDQLTSYFKEYKLQKLTNHIWPEFRQKVLDYAVERPYNKLQARSTIAAKLKKDGTQLFFFDALGVEYMAYILSKCDQYGLTADVSIGVCQLPSVTSMNKDFIPYFPGECRKIDALDELKHHSQVFDYQKRKEPIHLFRELEVIDEQLRQIRSQLLQEQFKKAVIISDHGASRLAVINEHLSESAIKMEEGSEHSGRCSHSDTDPKIPYAAYTPDGYVVLANYDRFKGGRPANVEVHGGATLEEVVVPVIQLMLKPSAIEIDFVEHTVQLKGHDPIVVTVYANISFSEPVLIVNINGEEKPYTGEFVGDHRHAKFTIPDIKRSRKYLADFYDGSKRLVAGMAFTVQKATQERNLF